MLTNGLLDPTIVAFVFTPVLVSAATGVTLLLRQASRDVGRGTAARLLPGTGPALRGERRPILGLLAVTAPPLALPFIYLAAVVIEAAGAVPDVVVRMLVVSTLAALVAGVPLGLASRWRQESIPCLTPWGIASSVGTCAYFLLGMRWLAGGD